MGGYSCRKVLPPTFMYIGEPHAGSTSLSKHLALRPELSRGSFKEHSFFSVNNLTAHPFRSEEEYFEEFMVDCNVTRTYDATPWYVSMGNEKLGKKWGQQHLRFGTPGADAVSNVRRVLGDDVQFVMMF